MRPAPDDPVEGIAPSPVPGRKKEPTRRRIVLTVQGPQQRDKLIAKGKYAVGIVGENFT